MSTQGLSQSDDLRIEERREQAAAQAHRVQVITRLMQSVGILVPFVLVLVAGIVLVPSFLSSSNVKNMLVNAAILAIVGFGMTLVIALRGIDLSAGSTQALAACIAAYSVNTWGVLPGILLGVITGATLGLVNGSIVTALKVPAFVATLSTMSIFRGLALLFTGGAPILVASATFKSFGIGSIAGIPVPFVVALVVGAGMWFLINRMSFGKHVIAVGGNPEAAVETGISTNRILMTSYMIAGALAGVAGVLIASQLGIVNASLSMGLELQAIAIVVLGGTSMAGGNANIVGTFIASLLLAMINAGLNLMNVPSFYQYVAIGLLLVFALSFDGLQRAFVRRAMEGIV